MIVLGDLHVKMGSENILTGHVMMQYVLGAMIIVRILWLSVFTTDPSIAEQFYFNISWVSTYQQATSHQVDHITINSRFKSCLECAKQKKCCFWP